MGNSNLVPNLADPVNTYQYICTSEALSLQQVLKCMCFFYLIFRNFYFSYLCECVCVGGSSSIFSSCWFLSVQFFSALIVVVVVFDAVHIIAHWSLLTLMNAMWFAWRFNGQSYYNRNNNKNSNNSACWLPLCSVCLLLVPSFPMCLRRFSLSWYYFVTQADSLLVLFIIIIRSELRLFIWWSFQQILWKFVFIIRSWNTLFFCFYFDLFSSGR